MTRTRIKICGVMTSQCAALAVDAGADAIGMVLHADAPRTISIDVARAIVAAVPPFVTIVGVFVNAESARVAEVTRALGLHHVQLHGDETPDDVAALGDLQVIKAIRPRGDWHDALRTWSDAFANRRLANLRGLLIESMPGGSGMENDWPSIQAWRSAPDPLNQIPYIAAGGLRVHNVAAVIHRLRPWAVDVSSGVEQSPGAKSAPLLAAFCGAVRVADEP